MARQRLGCEKRAASVQGTSGAPWPPRAMSAGWKVGTVGRVVRVARTEGSPSWSVEGVFDFGFWILDFLVGGRWQTVWPWEARAVMFLRGVLEWARSFSVARANCCATWKLSWQSSSMVVVAGAIMARRRWRILGGQACSMW